MSLELLKGAYDLHIHTAPDVMSRKIDDLDMAERAQKVGMKGFGIKSHYFCTAERARLVKKIYPDVNAIGAISLNNSVGGLNPLAVEMAARDGAKIVWMPTFDAENEQLHFKKGKHSKLPYWAKLQMELIEQGKTQESITILDDGKLKPEVIEILEIVNNYNLILATGHLGKKEISVLVDHARNIGVERIVITHPNFPSIDLSKEEQKELAEKGAFMEHCFTTPHSDKVTWERVIEEIRYVGPSNVILSTDLGQPNGLYPDEGLLIFVEKLLENGFSEEEIKQMTVENTTFLVEGEKLISNSFTDKEVEESVQS